MHLMQCLEWMDSIADLVRFNLFRRLFTVMPSTTNKCYCSELWVPADKFYLFFNLQNKQKTAFYKVIINSHTH